MKRTPDQLISNLKALIKRASEAAPNWQNNGLNEAIDELDLHLKRTSDHLDNSKQRMQTLIAALPVGLLITTEAAVIEAANPAAVTLFRCTYTDLVGRRLEEIFTASQTLSPDSDINKGQPVQCRAMRADGTLFPVDILIRSFASLNQDLWLVLVEDVTARHEIERMKEEFVSMVSHDLRAPLTSIQCFLELIAVGNYDNRLTDMKEKARGIDDDARRLIQMVNNLLDMQKMEAGRLDMYFDVIPCGQIVKPSVVSVQSLADKQNVRIVVGDFDPLLHVRADCDYIVQVLVNFLSNAIKFSAEGDAVTVTVTDDGHSAIKVSVRDCGPGFSAEFAGRIFNRFEQARVSDARLKGGTGLGLAISKSIVEQHGGTIGADSEEGKGKHFLAHLA
jgi:signal transduction histidine kinase